MAAPPLLHLQDIHLTYGATPLLQGATLAVGRGDRVALVGRNGSGKSTLLAIAAGRVRPDAGTRFLQPGSRLAVLAQAPDLDGYDSVAAYVEAGLPEDERYRAAPALDALGLSGALDPATLSGGEARRAALARALAFEPDILLLDEPTNHLDLPAIEALEATLLAYPGAIVVVSHDRRFLERVSRSMVWLDRGRTRRLEQGFAGFEAWRDQVLEEEERDAHKLSRKIAREEDWLRYGVTARRKRNVRRLAELGALRKARRERVAALGNARLDAVEATGSGSLVVLADGVTKAWPGPDGGERVVVRNFTTRILRSDRIGIVGPNGAGKTTLLGLLTGALQPDAGRVVQGTQLQIGTLDQGRRALDPDATLAETLTGGQGDQVVLGSGTRHVASYMKDFLFQPEQARTPLRMLSGGERARAALARMFAQPTNLLVLDEPTNDLDLETLDLLQEQLAEYGGTVILVSHDRDILDRVATATIAWEGEGNWVEYPGGYSDLAAQRGQGVWTERAPGDAARRAPGTGTGRAAAAAQAAAEPRSNRPSAATSSRMTFKEKHALATLPERIASLEAEIAQARATLADATLYRRDRPAFERTSAALEHAEAELREAEEQWLTLELKREELEGG